MTVNLTIQQGRLPFDLKFYEGDDKKAAMMMGQISVRRNYKKPEDEYYPEDILDFKAFAAQAEFINNYFSKGDNIILHGEVRKNDNYEKDGNTVYGTMYIHVTAVHFQQGNGEKSGGDSKPKASAKPTGNKPGAKPTPSKPKASNPLSGRKQSIL